MLFSSFLRTIFLSFISLLFQTNYLCQVDMDINLRWGGRGGGELYGWCEKSGMLTEEWLYSNNSVYKFSNFLEWTQMAKISNEFSFNHQNCGGANSAISLIEYVTPNNFPNFPLVRFTFKRLFEFLPWAK